MKPGQCTEVRFQHFGLPLFQRCGQFFEALVCEFNGFFFLHGFVLLICAALGMNNIDVCFDGSSVMARRRPVRLSNTASQDSTNVNMKAREILSLFSFRWSIEVTHFDCKQHLGLENAANRKEKAVLRTTPMAMFLHSLIVVWYASDGHKDFQIPNRPCVRGTGGRQNRASPTC